MAKKKTPQRIKEFSQHYNLMSMKGLETHAYKLLTLEESYQSKDRMNITSQVILPSAILKKDKRPGDVYSMTPHSALGSKGYLPPLKTIENAFKKRKTKQDDLLLPPEGYKAKKKLTKSQLYGKVEFKGLFELLGFTRNENLVSANSRLETLGSVLGKGYLHPMIFYYLGLLTISIGLAEDFQREKNARNRAVKMRYTIKCFELFLKYLPDYELNARKNGEKREMNGLILVKQFVTDYRRRHNIRDEYPEYKELLKEMSRLSISDGLTVHRKFLAKCNKYFFFRGMLQSVYLMYKTKIHKFPKAETERDAIKHVKNDTTGHMNIANTIYLMSLAYTHPHVDKQKILIATKFFNELDMGVQIEEDAETLHLALARGAYQIERQRYDFLVERFSHNSRIQMHLSRIELLSLGERAFRFELMKFDYYRTGIENRNFKLSTQHVNRVQPVYPGRYILELLDFQKKLLLAMNRRTEAHELEYKIKEASAKKI